MATLMDFACWYSCGLFKQEYEQLFAAFWWTVNEIKYKDYGYVTPWPWPRNTIFYFQRKDNHLNTQNKTKWTFKVYSTEIVSCMYVFIYIYISIIEWILKRAMEFSRILD